jgi:hypothetical protein
MKPISRALRIERAPRRIMSTLSSFPLALAVVQLGSERFKAERAAERERRNGRRAA